MASASDRLPFLRQTLQRAFSADMSHLMQASSMPSRTCMREKVCASRMVVFHFSTAVATCGDTGLDEEMLDIYL